MRLPNALRAVVDPEKLDAYCLSPYHPRGKHKARVFESALGLTQRQAPWLREALLQAARTQEAHPGESDAHGSRYVLDFTCSGPGGEAQVRSYWIVRAREDFPRLVTCYVMGEKERP